MKVSVNNLARAIYESSSDKKESELVKLNQDIIELIQEKNMLSKTDQILEALEKIIDEEEGLVRIKVSAKGKISKTVTNEIEEFIKERYGAKNVMMTFEENPKLLGGIKIQIGDEIIDTTLSNKLSQLQDYLITN